MFRLWMATVERAPTAIAVIEGSSGRKWTRAGLAAAAARWADALPRRGGRCALAGQRVAMSLPNGAEWFQVFIGLMAVGAVPVPIDPSEPDLAQAAAARSLRASGIWREGRLHLLSPPSHARRLPKDECLVKLTSGSSGEPKGLSATHNQMEADGRQICAAMGILPGDSNLAAIPLGYSYGLGNLVVPLILQGSRVICLSGILPHAIAAEAQRFRPTVFPAVPPILKALAGSGIPRRALASVRLVISAGSRLAPEIARSFADTFGIRVHGFYGTSETGGISFDASGDATFEGRSVGPPMGGVRIAFRPGGRFSVAGPAVLGEGRFSPPDRAVMNGLGELVLLGRTDRVVKLAGRRVQLAEIEAALRSIQGVRDAFAHVGGGVDSPLCAAVATELASSEVRRLLRSRLAPWKIPSRIAALREFPASARGKTDARRLRQILSAPLTVASISTFSSGRQISAPR